MSVTQTDAAAPAAGRSAEGGIDLGDAGRVAVQQPASEADRPDERMRGERLPGRSQGATVTPRQNATRPRLPAAADDGSG